MKTSAIWIIRVALTVQFLGVLAVPAIVFAGESPRALWMAEWLNPRQAPALSESNGRNIGVLVLRESTLSFRSRARLTGSSICRPSGR